MLSQYHAYDEAMTMLWTYSDFYNKVFEMLWECHDIAMIELDNIMAVTMLW